jgi:hypothetical protein
MPDYDTPIFISPEEYQALLEARMILFASDPETGTEPWRYRYAVICTLIDRIEGRGHTHIRPRSVTPKALG